MGFPHLERDLKINLIFLPSGTTIVDCLCQVTVILPNCKEEDQEAIKSLIKERGTNYTVQGLSLEDLISPVFIEGFVKRGGCRL